MSAFNAIVQNSLSYKLSHISIRELFYLEKAPCDIYGKIDGLFKLIIKEQCLLNNDVLRDLISKEHANIFIEKKLHKKIISIQQENLRHLTRSLSIGSPLEKSKKQINLLTICLKYLYDEPTNDDYLSLQYQSLKNLCQFLYDRPEIYADLYQKFIQQNHHFILAQPMLSSFFLIGALKHSKIFNYKEVESLFITSYFKDIGMSSIPMEKYNKKVLTDEDRQLLSEHPKTSLQILEGRIQLSPNHFKIIENHHIFSLLEKDQLNPNQAKNEIVVSGLEVVLISSMDIIAAMTTDRPYAKATTLYDALELIKLLIAEEYPQEFRIIVSYFKTLFANQ